MRIGDHLALELDDTLQRLAGQVLDLVPAERQLEQFPESNSIAWAVFHTARHAELALAVLGVPSGARRDVAGLGPEAWAGGAGLQEVQQAWFAEPDIAAVRAYHAAVFADARAFLIGLDESALDRVPDALPTLDAAGVLDTPFGWLRGQWAGQPVSFYARWPLTAHLTHHVGEAITYRNQMGLSPFR